MLPEDILKNHTIPEIRTIIKSLHSDATSKQVELQQMVGSRYHDFIQSADHISCMQQNAIEMAAVVEKFSRYSEDLIEKTRKLLKSSNSKFGDASSSPLEVSSSAVWSSLEDCDIYEASKIVTISSIIVDTLKGQNFRSIYFQKYFSNSLRDLVYSIDFKEEEAVSSTFLVQTVVDDAKLLLAYDRTDAASVGARLADKARLLAGVGLLRGLGRSELLALFLDAVSLQLEDVINVDIVIGLDDDSIMATAGLVTAGRVLQTAIFEVHVLFFKQFEHRNRGTAGSDEISNAQFGPGFLLAQGGLLSLFQLQFIRDVGHTIVEAAGSTAADKSLTFDFTSFVSDERLSVPLSESRKVFDRWMGVTIERIAARSETVLSRMTSATEVARLQQNVWQSSTAISVYGAATRGRNDDSSSIPSPIDHYHPNLIVKDEDFDVLVRPEMKANDPSLPAGLVTDVQQQLSQSFRAEWSAACSALLAPKTAGSKTKSTAATKSAADAADPSILLWSLVFRKPFMRQVERLLRLSCDDILGNVKEAMSLALAQEGVVVDLSTLTFTIDNDSKRQEQVKRETNIYASSPRIHARAEHIRSLIEQELWNLRAEIVLPVQEGDPQNALALSRALFVQCAHLVARIVIMTRLLVSKLADATSSSLKTTTNQDSALSALILLGRIAWLMKVRGRFLEEALSPHAMSAVDPRKIGLTSASSAYQQFYEISEDQMVTAFEIADTDGDGLITFSEAIEAVQALNVPESGSGTEDATKAFAFLSSQLTPSMTFSEFSLLCAHLTSYEACRPVQRLAISTELMSVFAHSAWVAHTASSMSAGLSVALMLDLGLGEESKGVFSAPFKRFWVAAGMEASDVDTVDLMQEKLLVPSRASSALLEYLSAITHRVYASLLSIDTVQQTPVAFNDLATEEVYLQELVRHSEEPEGRGLTAHVPGESIVQLECRNAKLLALREALNTYTEIARPLIAASSSSLGGDMPDGFEDTCLQLVFDLNFCQEFAAESSKDKTIGSLAAGFKDMIARLKLLIDPINAELLLPLIEQASRTYAARVSLFAFVGMSAYATAANNLPAASAPSEADSVVGHSIFCHGTLPRFSLLPLSFGAARGSSSGAGALRRGAKKKAISNETADTSTSQSLLQQTLVKQAAPKGVLSWLGSSTSG